MPAIPLLGWTLASGLIINILGVFYLVWLLNLYNFMDGIDGIAALEALVICVAGAILYYVTDNTTAAFLPLSLAVAVAGFLFWNFPPARIFMGDAGSGFLGLILGILSIQAATVEANFFWSWLILLGVFIVDATVTLLRRGISGEIHFEAHCSHAYQHASRYYGKHRTVTLGVLLIDLLWLFPIAIAVGLNIINGSLGLVIAYFPLYILALKFKAGKKE
jgi:Fuc2NAc and GlcNAc transferase